jgi:hypothetical protein
MLFGMSFKYDPGPCPVDGMPHTTCTPQNPQPIVDVQTPGRDALVAQRAAAAAAATPPVAPPPVEETFTTKTYRRPGPRR